MYRPFTRRELLTGCGVLAVAGWRGPTAAADVDALRLRARPRVTSATIEPGEQRLEFSSGRGALLHVPAAAAVGRAVPLWVMLHGAGGRGDGMRGAFEHGERLGAAVLAPDSRGRTWDLMLGGFGPDVAFIDRVLDDTFGRVQIDAAQVTIGGFSDGASYALSLGLANGTLFSRVIAFSPGFNTTPLREGRPRLFVSHGVDDEILPIDATSRRFVPALRSLGYDVTYVEFLGGHSVPKAISKRAFDWTR